MMLQSLAALALVLAIFAGLVWAMRRLQQGSLGAMGRGGSAIRVVQRLSLDSRSSIVEIEREGRRYLLGVSQSGVARIDTIEMPEATGESVDEPADDEVSDGG